MKVSSKRFNRMAKKIPGKYQDMLCDGGQSDMNGIVFTVANPEPSLTEYLAEKDHQDELERRELFVIGEIGFSTVDEAVCMIRRYNREDKMKNIPPAERKPIFIHIFSQGGDCFSGNMLLDHILQSKTPVYTINDGIAESMAAMLFISGHKRFAFQRSVLMLHAGSLSLDADVSKAEDFVDFNKRVKEDEAEFVTFHSKLNVNEYKIHSREDWYMKAIEAKDLGMVDFVIGLDCDLDDVLPIPAEKPMKKFAAKPVSRPYNFDDDISGPFEFDSDDVADVISEISNSGLSDDSGDNDIGNIVAEILDNK